MEARMSRLLVAPIHLTHFPWTLDKEALLDTFIMKLCNIYPNDWKRAMKQKLDQIYAYLLGPRIVN